MRRGGALRNKSSGDVVRLLRYYGFELVRRGRHDTYEHRRGEDRRIAQVPRNKHSIPPKTLYAILTQAGITKDEAREFWG